MTSNDSHEMQDDTPTDRDPASAGDEVERQRLARLIGQILARHWLRTRTTQGGDVDDALDCPQPDGGQSAVGPEK